MHVVATAGHVDHGKSTLVQALTGMQPDRWAEEQRRSMTIDLGFAWTTLPSGRQIAFVDVPGHERFVSNMLAGVGPVPAVLMAVAADEGWMPQSAEHLAALDALGVRHGLLAITRADLADPGPAAHRARAELAASTLGQVEVVAVSAKTGHGLDDLRAALDRLIAGLPAPTESGPVRMWVDRSFSIRGAGTVVTGTLTAGSLHTGDELEIAPTGTVAQIRALHCLGQAVEHTTAVARAAVNLRGLHHSKIHRGEALLTPSSYLTTTLIDVRLHGDPVADLPPALTLHIGSAAVVARIRPLGADTARLALSRPLPLLIGDRALLRDPGRHQIAGGVTVLDVDPPPLRRRGAAAERAATLSTMTGHADERSELRRRLLVRRGGLQRMGVPVTMEPVAGDWLADPDHWARLRQRLGDEVSRHARQHPLEPGIAAEELRHLLDLPDRALVDALLTPPLATRDGRVHIGEAPPALPEPVAQAIVQIRAELAEHPFHAPEADRLKALGLGRHELAAARRAGELVQLTADVVLLPDAIETAATVLAALPQPFTTSDARKALGTTRRVAVPLLEMLDHRGLTRRLPDDTRTMSGRSQP